MICQYFVCIEFVHPTQHSSVVRLRGKLTLSAAASTLSIAVVSAGAVGAVVGAVVGPARNQNLLLRLYRKRGIFPFAPPLTLVVAWNASNADI